MRTRAPLRRPLATIALACGSLGAPGAQAQLHWDAGAEVGVAKRFPSGGEAGASSPSLGPAFELQAHVALVPMLRVGAYAAQDVSPVPGAGVRTYWEGGLHAKVTPPLLSAPWRAYAFAGFGYAYTYAASHRGVPPGGAAEVLFAGVSGGMLDAPVGLGIGARAPGAMRSWVVFAVLAGRFGVAFYGPMYAGGAPPSVAGGASGPALFLGKDSFALSLSVGLSLEQ
jgi:hypothetical protein